MFSTTTLLRGAIGTVLVLAGFLAAAAPVSAHDPVFVTDDQTTPEVGPLLPDGTISFALYGEVNEGGDTRGLQAQFEEGDRLFVELLVPDREPENTLAAALLPSVQVLGPDGSSRLIEAPITGSFFEPFTSTSYLRIGTIDTIAVAGVYDIIVTGNAPARFTVAVGNRETFGTPVERVENRIETAGDLTTELGVWYEVPPTEVIEPAPATTSTTVPPTESAAEPLEVEAAQAEPTAVATTTATTVPEPGPDPVATAPSRPGQTEGPGVALWILGGAVVAAVLAAGALARWR